MRTTIDLPENLILEAMSLTGISTKTDMIKEALKNIIEREKIKSIKKFRGKIKLEIDFDSLRKR